MKTFKDFLKENEETELENITPEVNETIDPEAVQTLAVALAGVAGIVGTAAGIAKLESYLKEKYPKAAEALAKLGKSATDSKEVMGRS